MFSTSLDAFAAPFVAAGARTVLTPSGWLVAGDWAGLRAVLDAGARTTRPDVLTLVAADAAVLDAPHEARFVAELAAAGRPLAVVLLAPDQPLGKRGRAGALRRLQAAVPGLSLLAAEPLPALDVVAGGGTGAVGYRAGLRTPRVPGTPGGRVAAGYLPGLLLSDLWTVRSPAVYADWFAGTASPRCALCARPLDVFAANDREKAVILGHNVHEVLAAADDLLRRRGTARRRAHLAATVVTALTQHAALHPLAPGHQADRVLRRFAELDDPAGRQVLPSGAFRP